MSNPIHEAAQRGIDALDGGMTPHRALRAFLVELRDLTPDPAEKPSRGKADEKPAKAK